jgi:hypothetical protein
MFSVNGGSPLRTFVKKKIVFVHVPKFGFFEKKFLEVIQFFVSPEK